MCILDFNHEQHREYLFLKNIPFRLHLYKKEVKLKGNLNLHKLYRGVGENRLRDSAP